jgi:hypothetical protein
MPTEPPKILATPAKLLPLPELPPENMFFIVGPLRTGSSLLSRCIDDHPNVISLCESEINRTLYPDHMTYLHHKRMVTHGFTTEECVLLLNGKKQHDFLSFQKWYNQAFPIAKELYKKPNATVFGDKSPDFHTSKELVNILSLKHTLIYTVRDPRAILRSIAIQNNSSIEEKNARWYNLINNFITWEAYLNQSNILTVRYEDLVNNPEPTMKDVYDHLDLDYSPRFLEPFSRAHPRRFLWQTAINWETGIREDFDKRRAVVSDDDLGEMQLEMIYKDPVIQRFMQRFGYGK